ncbi:hypothetical protein V6O07_23980 [Arthrospira platensis SPKY2]
MVLYKYKKSINTFHKPFYGIHTKSFIHIDSRNSQCYNDYVTPCYNYDWCCRFNCGAPCNLDLIPLSLNFNIYSKVDKNWFVPTNLNELEQLEKPRMTSPRFFIRISKPINDNSAGSIGYIEEYILIPYKGPLINNLKIWLTKSLTRDLEGSYFVEYWSIHKAFYPKNYKRFCELVCVDTYREIEDTGSKRLLKTEYWNIKNNYSCNPCSSSNDLYINMIRRDEDSKPRDYNMDYISDNYINKVMDIKELRYNNNIINPSYYQLITEFSKNELSPYLNDSYPVGVGIKWLGENRPPLGSNYTLICSKPLDLCDIIYTPTKKEQYLLTL